MPTGTFDLSGTPEKDLRRARCLLFIIYVGLGGFFVYTLYQLFVVGRVEVTSTMYKVDSLEAPSIVVCPFWPGTSIRPLRDQPVELWFYSVQGPVRMNTTPKTCRFDRVCICLDLEGRLQFTERKQAETGMIGTMGDKLNLTSDRQMEFKERLELRAWVQDPSPDSTLKIGFYDSVDSTPVWSYTREKSQMIGNLELVEWIVSSISFNNLIATIFDKRNRMQERRHIYKYNAQSVGAIKDDAALPLEVASVPLKMMPHCPLRLRRPRSRRRPSWRRTRRGAPSTRAPLSSAIRCRASSSNRSKAPRRRSRRTASSLSFSSWPRGRQSSTLWSPESSRS